MENSGKDAFGTFQRALERNARQVAAAHFRHKAREAHIDNEIVNLWQGHTPGKNVTATVYTHFSMDYQKEQAKKLNNY